MCNDYAREIELGRVISLLKEMEGAPPLDWASGRIPNDAEPTSHIKIGDKGITVRFDGEALKADMTTWAWKGPGGKPVFNFRSESRDFSNSDRVAILTTGFYEYTAPTQPKVKLKDQHFFTMPGQEFFWIAGIVKQGAFAMLTTSPGPDVKPYHDRQVCVLEPRDGLNWLNLSQAEDKLLKPLPIGSLRVRTLRRDGTEISSQGDK